MFCIVVSIFHGGGDASNMNVSGDVTPSVTAFYFIVPVPLDDT
jgi:hypothetical protein